MFRKLSDLIQINAIIHRVDGDRWVVICERLRKNWCHYSPRRCVVLFTPSCMGSETGYKHSSVGSETGCRHHKLPIMPDQRVPVAISRTVRQSSSRRRARRGVPSAYAAKNSNPTRRSYFVNRWDSQIGIVWRHVDYPLGN